MNSGAIFLLPVRCDSRGCYSLKEGEDAPWVNLLELACPDDDDWFTKCETVAAQLAAALGWKWCWDDQEGTSPSQTA